MLINRKQIMSLFKFPPIGMSPSVWGPLFWTTMHIVSLGFPTNPTDDEKEAASAFFSSLQFMIPCPICKEHYASFLKGMPIATQSRDTLINWVFDLHNKVNQQLGKPAISFEQYISNMSTLAQKKSVNLFKDDDNIKPFLGGIAVSVATIAAIWYFYPKLIKI
jgi:FAD-linked sulfhydryl oxidase